MEGLGKGRLSHTIETVIIANLIKKGSSYSWFPFLSINERLTVFSPLIVKFL